MLNNLLAVFLLFIFPALNLWISVRPKKEKPPRSLMHRYWSMSWQSLVLLAVLWVGSAQVGYTPRDLGFDIPLSNVGAWGLGFAVLLLTGLSVAGHIIERRKTPEARAKSEKEMLELPMPWPRSTTEVLAFAISIFIMTAGWEVLYRGFLLQLLPPIIGLPFAIVASALAYGIAHGYKNPKELIASIISAFIFTIAYAWTHSIWWLILIHVGLPLLMFPGVIRTHRRRKVEDLGAAEERIQPEG